LGDIVYKLKLDQTLEVKRRGFWTVEAVKTFLIYFLPLAGEIIEFNDALESKPETVNRWSHMLDGWLK
jgi:glycine cleavage system H protein